MASTLNADVVAELEPVVDSPLQKQFQTTTVLTEDSGDEFVGLPSGDVTSQNIAQFFAGRYIFLTGATGFVGKVLIEKILYSCPNVAGFYILIRPKRGKSIEERIDHLLGIKLFDRLRNRDPDFSSKIMPINGDIYEPELGISAKDVETLKEKVSIVYHSAASVRFDDPIRLAVEMNVRGTEKILKLCRRLKKLVSAVHVSTAYANCDRTQILESIYPPPTNYQKWTGLIDWMDDASLEKLTPSLLGERPNTYTYTKAIAEHLIAEEAAKEEDPSLRIPMAIVRPSIVGASWKEPFPGWIDNFNGPTGIFAAIGNGLLRVMKGDAEATADVIPVDVTVNVLIASAWFTATQRPDATVVYNCTTGAINRLTWGQMEKVCTATFINNPLDRAIRVPHAVFTKKTMWHSCKRFIDEVLPAYVLDLGLGLMGRKTEFIRLQDRLAKTTTCLEFFTSNGWDFGADNVLQLKKSLSAHDKHTFNFDVAEMDWNEYLENYVIGTKVYALKENIANLPVARKHMRRLRYISWAAQVFLAVLMWRLLVSKTAFARRIWLLIPTASAAIVKALPNVAKAR